jgi:hypothetical protein
VNTDGELRASDAERSATAELLRRHHAEGRIDTAELEERIERCYAAKMRGELEALTVDLPGSRRERRNRSRPGLLPLPLIAIAFVVALAITTHAHVLWLVWPLAFFAFARFGGHRRWRMQHSRTPSGRQFPH